MPTLTDHAAEHRVSRAQFEAFRCEREQNGDRARFELLDGEILMPPSPTGIHQLVVSRLVVQLSRALRPGWEVVPAPLDVLLRVGVGDTTLHPDVVLTTRTLLTDDGLTVPPELVVEVLSPATWRRDLGPKATAYQAVGVPHYWVVAPYTPSITVYRLGADGAYREQAHLRGEQTRALTEPVPILLCPADLTR